MLTQRVKPTHTKLLINNELVEGEQKQTIDIFNPSTEEKIATVSRATIEDADKAVEAAYKAKKGEWRKMSAHQRGKIIARFADLLEKHIPELADLESQNCGKPIDQTFHFEMQTAVKCFRYYAGYCDKIHGQVIPVEGDFFCYTRKEPVGVCAQMIAWNYPLVFIGMKAAPCLAAGSVSIIKCSDKTPLTAMRITEFIKEAGFPPGVFQIITGNRDVLSHLSKHPKVDKFDFIGSTEVGKILGQNGYENNVKRVTLELGGKSAHIICDDADLDFAAQQVIMGGFANQGQLCIAGTRVFVHEKIHDKFVQTLVNNIKGMQVSDPFTPGTHMGPMIDHNQLENALKYVELGIKEGATLACGGKRIGSKGNFVEPTVFTNVQDNMTIAREEILGPVLCVFKYSDYKEVIERANNTHYGLGAGIITNNIELQQMLTNELEAGVVFVNSYTVVDVNSPFGGCKSSGIGRDFGEQALDNYLEFKTVMVKRNSTTLP